MSTLFHVNPESGATGRCGARKGNCPFGGSEGGDNHYDSPEAASQAAEQLMEEKYSSIINKSYRKKDEGFEIGEEAAKLLIESSQKEGSKLHPSVVAKVFSTASNEDVRILASQNMKSQKILREMSEDESASVRLAVANSTNNPEVLKRLSEDSDPKVREAAINNSKAPVKVRKKAVDSLKSNGSLKEPMVENIANIQAKVDSLVEKTEKNFNSKQKLDDVNTDLTNNIISRFKDSPEINNKEFISDFNKLDKMISEREELKELREPFNDLMSDPELSARDLRMAHESIKETVGTFNLVDSLKEAAVEEPKQTPASEKPAPAPEPKKKESKKKDATGSLPTSADATVKLTSLQEHKKTMSEFKARFDSPDNADNHLSKKVLRYAGKKDTVYSKDFDKLSTEKQEAAIATAYSIMYTHVSKSTKLTNAEKRLVKANIASHHSWANDYNTASPSERKEMISEAKQNISTMMQLGDQIEKRQKEERARSIASDKNRDNFVLSFNSTVGSKSDFNNDMKNFIDKSLNSYNRHPGTFSVGGTYEPQKLLGQEVTFESVSHNGDEVVLKVEGERFLSKMDRFGQWGNLIKI